MIEAVCLMPRMSGRGYTAAMPVIIRRQVENAIYKCYVTDVLASLAKANGVTVSKRYADAIGKNGGETVCENEEETAEKIIERITNKLKGVGRAD